MGWSGGGRIGGRAGTDGDHHTERIVTTVTARLAPIAGRVLASFAVALVATTLAHFDLVLSRELARDITEICVTYAAIALGHKAISARVNPNDAASPALVPVGKEAKQIVQDEKAEADR
jgi:hypothetical protein